MNNGYLGMVRQWQELFWDKRYSHVDMGSYPDFVKLADAYGATGHAASPTRTRSSTTCARRSRREGPVLVDVRVTQRGERVPDDPGRPGRAGHGGVSGDG